MERKNQIKINKMLLWTLTFMVSISLLYLFIIGIWLGVDTLLNRFIGACCMLPVVIMTITQVNNSFKEKFKGDLE